MGSRWGLRVCAVSMVIASISGGLVPSAASAADGSRPVASMLEIDTGLQLRMLRQMEEMRAPKEIIDALRDDADARVRQGRAVIAYPMGDLTRDGVPEVMESEFRYSLSISDDGQAINTIETQDFTTILRVRDGRNGQLHWKKRYGDFVLTGQARVGTPARPGLIAVGGILSFFGGSSGQRYLTFNALRGTDGKQQWSKRYMSVAASYDFTTNVATDSPVSFAFVQARKDKATEILIGLSTITEAAFTATTAVTRTLLLSAADGSEVMHPHLDVGIDWLPFPDPVPDVDGDGLDDYVVINDKGVYGGGGQEPPAVGGTIQARRGLEGDVVWTEGGLEFNYFAFAISLPNVLGDGTRDFGVLTYHRRKDAPLVPILPMLPIGLIRHQQVVMLADGGAGQVQWTKPGHWIHSPGDVDRDGDHDVVIERFRFDDKGNVIHYTRLAHRGAGARIWRHDLEWRGDPCLVRRCIGGAGGAAGAAGDVHPDGISDRFVWMVRYQAHTEEYRSFVLDGDSDETLIRSDDTLMPLGVAVDAHGSDVLNAGLQEGEPTFRAREGDSGDPLWTLRFAAEERLLPGRFSGFGLGFDLPRDRCGDVVLNLSIEAGTLFGVIDGASGRIVWSKWTGPEDQRPRTISRKDLNPACSR